MQFIGISMNNHPQSPTYIPEYIFLKQNMMDGIILNALDHGKRNSYSKRIYDF